MIYKILIIDDEWNDNRKTKYEKLIEKINSTYPSFEIILDHLEKPDRSLLRIKLHQNVYSAVITDAILDGAEGWDGFTITDVVAILYEKVEKIPTAIVSAYWDSTVSEHMTLVLNKLNCRTFLHWRDIEANGNGNIRYAMESVIRMLTDSDKLDIATQLEPDEDVRIVHISDVHTGNVKDEALKNQTVACANAILNYWQGKNPSFVAFTGDVTEYGSPTQYASAKTWIKLFFNCLKMGDLPSRNLLYVPGNHDVNLCLAAGSRINLSKDTNDNLKMTLGKKIMQPELIDYAYVPFRNFLNDICYCPLFNDALSDHVLAWVEARFRHLGVLFYGLNTARPAKADDLPGREVHEDDLADINIELSKITANSDNHLFAIGLGHHSPVSADHDDSAVSNISGFKTFFQSGEKKPLFLHGHSHESEIADGSISSVRLVRSGAPTLRKTESSRPSDTLRGFHLLTLHRKNHEVKSIEICEFTWQKHKVNEGEKKFYTLQNEMLYETHTPIK